MEGQEERGNYAGEKMKLANIKGLLIGIAAAGISFAFLGGPMGGRPGSSDTASAGSNASASSGMPMGGGMGGGLPLLEIGIGLAILAVLIWWFDLREQGKKQ
jgi:hypothetical protein